jgi:hypothetical protein
MFVPAGRSGTEKKYNFVIAVMDCPIRCPALMFWPVAWLEDIAE